MRRRELLQLGAATVTVACGGTGRPSTLGVDASPDGRNPFGLDAAGDASPEGGADANGVDANGADASGAEVTELRDASTEAGPDATVDAPDDATAADDALDASAASDAADSPDVVEDAPTDVVDSGPEAPPCPASAGARRVTVLGELPVGRWVADPALRVLLSRDARGIFALSAVCTHSGCTVTTPADGATAIECGCHGSRFDADGAVLMGPARTPLDAYAAEVCGGDVYVDPTRSVAGGSRAPVS